ncbi:DegV family protein [Olsenella urininfantis]|uniref:DegV family protein n=1 Tax=Olsenella urininfantis TaxID=1871033 RepID=UPI000985DC8E|nr:DegV family protein [Olsenella urininfantis]
MEEARPPRFAIVCDSGCDLPLDNLEAAGVAMVPLVVRTAGKEHRDCIDLEPNDFFVRFSAIKGQVDSFAPSQDAFLEVYQRLADEGHEEIISLHVSSLARDAYDIARAAADKVEGARVHVVDSRCVSSQMALVLARLVSDRDNGVCVAAALKRIGEASLAARILVIPAPDAKPRLRGYTKARSGVLGRVDSLRARAIGVRRVFCIDDDGAAQELYRSTELHVLAGRMARSMSWYARKVGPLTYVELTAGAPRLLPTLEKPLDTNEFESTRAAVISTNPSTTTQLGIGAVGIAYVPSSLVTPLEAARLMGAVE